MSRIETEVICDSVNAANGRRATTMKVTYPWFAHPDFMTHRVFARNAASSRAIPTYKMLREVWERPAVPTRFGRLGKGMQDRGALSNSATATARFLWLAARYPAMAAAWLLLRLRVHKQVANMVLLPWLHITVVVTATQWENFYRQRFHPAARPEMQLLAERMLRAHAASRPKKVAPGEWHLPFWREVDERRLEDEYGYLSLHESDELACRLRICAARCARTSYLNFYGKDDPADDARLHDDLKADNHWSPFEHALRAEAEDRFFGHTRGYTPYRKLFPKETHDGDAAFDPVALLAELEGATK